METSSPISRREAIHRVTMLLGGVAIIDGDRVLAALPGAAAQQIAAAQGTGEFTREEVVFLDEIAETILPETSTPGAKAARTGAFMALMVTDAYTPRNRQIFRDGMLRLDEACTRDYGTAFVQARPGERLALLQRLDAEQKAQVETVHYFRLMKELALLGYFTSEIGYRQAMRYVETPGRYDPCAPYKPGEKIWAPHA